MALPHACRFQRFELRCADLLRAEAFYRHCLDWQIVAEGPALVATQGGTAMASLTRFGEREQALGVPPHWLAYVKVDDIDRHAERLRAGGATVLGPIGDHAIRIRDPQGTVVAITRDDFQRTMGAAWIELHTTDLDAAWAWHREQFGWSATSEPRDAPPFGTIRMFGWDPAGPSVGAMLDSARRPEVHPHWLVYWRVANLEQTLGRVCRQAGRVIGGPLAFIGSDRIAVCEDDQGAAFALTQRT